VSSQIKISVTEPRGSTSKTVRLRTFMCMKFSLIWCGKSSLKFVHAFLNTPWILYCHF